MLYLQNHATLVDTPGVGESNELTRKLTEYMSEAIAFIYVINTPNAGGVQKDRVLAFYFLFICTVHIPLIFFLIQSLMNTLCCLILSVWVWGRWEGNGYFVCFIYIYTNTSKSCFQHRTFFKVRKF